MGNAIGAMAKLPTCTDDVFELTPPSGGGGGSPSGDTDTDYIDYGVIDTTVSGCQCLAGVYYEGFTVRRLVTYL